MSDLFEIQIFIKLLFRKSRHHESLKYHTETFGLFPQNNHPRILLRINKHIGANYAPSSTHIYIFYINIII